MLVRKEDIEEVAAQSIRQDGGWVAVGGFRIAGSAVMIRG